MLDAQTLRAYGILLVRGERFSVLELGSSRFSWRNGPRLVRGYGDRMGRIVAPGEVEAALIWLDPARDTALARTWPNASSKKGERSPVSGQAPASLSSLVGMAAR